MFSNTRIYSNIYIFHLEGDKLTSTPSNVPKIKTPVDYVAIY